MIGAVGNDRQFRAFAAQVKPGPRAGAPMFATNAARAAHRCPAIGGPGKATAARKASAALAAVRRGCAGVRRATVPAGLVNDIAAARASPGAAAKRLRIAPAASWRTRRVAAFGD